MAGFYEMRTLVSPNAIRQDYVGGNQPIYMGEAEPGTLNSEKRWRIRRLTYNGTKLETIEWADGNGNFDNVWDDRASLSYS